MSVCRNDWNASRWRWSGYPKDTAVCRCSLDSYDATVLSLDDA